MKYRRLIAESKASLEKDPGFIDAPVSPGIFGLGAKWMFDKLNDKKTAFNPSVNYSAYGAFKYGISFFGSLYSAFLLSRLGLLYVPLSIVVFYVIEVHFLFLFPLLIDNVPNPLRASIKQTYKTGFFNSLFTVIPIGFYMVIGLLRINDPFRNWYIGCLAILTWYQHEIRNRI